MKQEHGAILASRVGTTDRAAPPTRPPALRLRRRRGADAACRLLWIGNERAARPTRAARPPRPCRGAGLRHRDPRRRLRRPGARGPWRRGVANRPGDERAAGPAAGNAHACARGRRPAAAALAHRGQPALPGRLPRRRYTGIGARVNGAGFIVDLAAGGPADRAGLRPGDAILNLEDLPIDVYPAGQQVALRLLRDGLETAAVVRIGAICNEPAAAQA